MIASEPWCSVPTISLKEIEMMLVWAVVGVDEGQWAARQCRDGGKRRPSPAGVLHYASARREQHAHVVPLRGWPQQVASKAATQCVPRPFSVVADNADAQGGVDG